MKEDEYPSITKAYASELIDYASKYAQQSKGLADMQLEGAVAIYNMLIRNRCAYLADEVGMGKTYVALGVMSLMRYLNPKARIVVIAPRENIQHKWVKELNNFVNNNWKVVGHRVKSIQGGPVWEPVLCNSLHDFAHEALLNKDRDFFLRMTSFSLPLSDQERRKKLRKSLFKLLPWLDKNLLASRSLEHYRENVGCVMNAATPEIDLLVVDEAHNLKHGLTKHSSTRNLVMSRTFGHSDANSKDKPWYMPKAKHVLLLSATPFEEDYAALYNQFSIFGFGNICLKGDKGEQDKKLSDLCDQECTLEEKRDIVGHIMIRRVTSLRISDKDYTKNMYRREWRKGGLKQHDTSIQIKDPKQKLVIALMQKKVAEVLQLEKFNNQFQIGMLSSFESFLQTVETKRRSQLGKEEDIASMFDGEQQATQEERKGIDTDVITEIVSDYRERFGTGLPHPKLDATAESIRSSFETGEKVLVFVRRCATVNELAAKLDGYFDDWIKHKLLNALPELITEVEALFTLYEEDRARRPEERIEYQAMDEDEAQPSEASEQRQFLDDSDEGSAETFFSWFFRGAGPKGYLSGAAFQKNRLSATSAVYSTLFEDDYVSFLLGYPSDVMGALAQKTGNSKQALDSILRNLAYGYFRSRSEQKEGYPRLYVYEAYQGAALELLENKGDETTREQARIILAERFGNAAFQSLEAPRGFPDASVVFNAKTFFTELIKRPLLREKIWPDETESDFRLYFRRREQRRELISAMCRLGVAYIDLYILAIRELNSFQLGRETEKEGVVNTLAEQFVDLLDTQSKQQGCHAYYELHLAAEVFDQIIATNFSETPRLKLSELASVYGATLQRQVPVGRMEGGVTKRLVRQFRMPGFPLVLISTEVLQEGEDLHTFCRKIIHYGIAWTPSSMEQRTGRVDRIGSLFERNANKIDRPIAGDDFIQVHYPYLQGTVEVLQVRRVLKRLNRFLELMHVPENQKTANETRIDVAKEMLSETEIQPAIQGLLESAFPIKKELLKGELKKKDFKRPDQNYYLEYFAKLWDELVTELKIDEDRFNQLRERSGRVYLEQGGENKFYRFTLELRSQALGDAVLLRGTTMLNPLDLRIDDNVEALIDISVSRLNSKVCIHPGKGKDREELSLGKEMLFHPKTTHLEEVSMLIQNLISDAHQASVLLNSRQ